MKKGKMDKNQLSTLTPEILTTLCGLCKIFHKMYCFPGQIKILEILDRRFSRKRSRSTLNRHLRRMEDDKLIIRIRRIRRDKVFGMVFNSTLYEITLKGYYVLRMLGVNVQKQISILKNVIKKKFGRPDLEEKKDSRKSELTALGDILEGVKRRVLT